METGLFLILAKKNLKKYNNGVTIINISLKSKKKLSRFRENIEREISISWELIIYSKLNIHFGDAISKNIDVCYVTAIMRLSLD